MEVANPPSTSGYRDEILSRLEKRNDQWKPFEGIFKSYSHLADTLSKARATGSARNRTMSIQQDGGGSASQMEMDSLREELNLAYKLKSKTDQEYIDASRRIVELEKQFKDISNERNTLLGDKTKLCARIAELEHAYKKTTDDNSLLKDEWTAMTIIVNTQKEKITQLEKEQLHLINKIRELNEQKANFMNAEVDRQAAKQKLKLQMDIASAIADTSRDSRANSIISQADGPTGLACLGDMPPHSAQAKFEAHESEILDVCWLDSDRFVTGGQDKKIRIWKVDANGRQSKMHTLTGCNNAITRLDYDLESKYLLASSNDSGVRVWNVDNQRLLSTLRGHQDKVNVARFHGTMQAVSGGSDRSIRLWDLRSERCVRSFFPGSTIHDIAGRCSFGSTSWISGHFDKKIRIWDGRNDQPVQVLEMAGKVTSIDVAMDGRSFLVSTRDDTLSLLDIRNMSTIHFYSAEQYKTSSDLSRCIISPGMEYIAAGSSDGHVFVWNLNNTKIEKALIKGGHEHAVLSVSWSPSGRGLLSCDKQKQVVYWN